MFKQNYTMSEQNKFEQYITSLGKQAHSYGNATHAFADILLFLSNGNSAASYNIIMPSFIPAKLYRILLAYGYKTKFYEIDKNCQFDINEVNHLIDSQTKAVFVIHYFGYPANIKPLREIADKNNIVLIEDCAHVVNGRYDGQLLGTWGDCAIFSPRKMLNLPEGGYLVLNKDFENFEPANKKRVNSLYTFYKLLQTRGKYFYLSLTNGKDLFGILKIPERGFIDYSRNHKVHIKNISGLSRLYSRTANIKNHIEARQKNYICLYEALKDLIFIRPLYKELPYKWTPYSFPVIVEGGYRDLLQMELCKAGISCGAGWPESPFGDHLTKTSGLAQDLIEFPVHPLIKINQLKRIIEVCISFERKILSGNFAPSFKEKNKQEKIFQKEDPGNDIKIKIIKSDDGFDNLGDEWVELCENSNVHIFQTFEWQRLWWKYFGQDKELYLLLFYSQNKFREEKLVGIAPFFLDVTSVFGIRVLRRLRLIGSGVDLNKSNQAPDYSISDYLDFVIQSGFEKAVAEALALYLKKNFMNYHIIQLDEVSTRSSIVKFLLPLLKNYKWEHKLVRSEVCPRITIPENINEYFKQLTSKVRYQLKKIKRDISSHSLFTISKVNSTYELKKSFDDFVSIHQKRWKHNGQSGLFSDGRYKAFLEEAAYAFLKKDYLFFTTAYSENECIAAECAFKYKKFYYDYLKAFDDQSSLAKYRPGRALLLMLIEDAIENNFDVVDLLRGGEPYKFEIATGWQWIYKVTISNPVYGYNVRYKFFKLILFYFYMKRFVLNEFNVANAQIKKYGITGLTSHYIPAVINKIRNKFVLQNSFPEKEPVNKKNDKKIIQSGGIKIFGMNKQKYAVRNNVSKVH